jgi:hypothetical protein
MEDDQVLRRQRLERAATALEPIIVPPDGQFADLTNLIAALAMQQGELEEAVRWSHKSIQADSTRWGPYLALAIVHWVTNEPELSRAYGQRFLASQQLDVETLLQAAQSARSSGDTELATLCSERARRLMAHDWHPNEKGAASREILATTAPVPGVDSPASTRRSAR